MALTERPAVANRLPTSDRAQWLMGRGQTAEKDEEPVEIETDKATVELSAPVFGRFSKVLKRTGEPADLVV